MTEQPISVIAGLKVVRDIMEVFIHLVDNLNKIAEKHGISLKDIARSGLSNPQAMQELITKLPPEKLGLFLIVVSEIVSMDSDFRNFMAYDESQTKQFREKLQGTIGKLDKVLEGL